ncbi:MAG: alpha-L-fucosidase [Bryobacterales bacterium]|nr:alpha-L-fucosidase [Bryobacterales bacterium]
MPNDISRREMLRDAAAGLGFLGFARFSPGAGLPPGVVTFRHIHLDFHTSPAITGVGEDFDASEFARVLKEAEVNSITIFAKCHHGMSYYPTRVGVRHPNLKIDLVGAMIEACHRQGIRVPVYISTMYDQRVWREHADWRAFDEEGKPQGLRGAAGPLLPQLGRVCINTPYLDYVLEQADEVLRTYEADGLFYDNFGYPAGGCLGPSCMLEREKLGLESARREDRQKHALMVMERSMHRFAATVRKRKPKASIYINGPARLWQDPQFLRRVTPDYTQFEIESLPGGSWGYSHFQMASRYLRNLGLEAQGMTGAFHRSWGDFGTVRNQAALDYECFSMLAQATKCAVGDHLHPGGRLNPRTYERIGNTYRSVREKEPWCEGAAAVTEMALLLNPGAPRTTESAAGATSMLTRLHHQFDLIDRESDFSRYPLLILADNQRLDAVLRDKLAAFLKAGGALVLSHESGLDEEARSFALPGMGLDYEGPWKHESQYIEALEPAREGIPDMVHEMYETGSAVKVQPGTTLLARVWEGYFDKDYRHFHVEQTPYARPSDYAAAAQRGRIVYFAVPIFRAYARNGYAVYRQLVGNTIRRLIPDPLVRGELPSTAQVTLTAQGSRRILHLLHYVPERRSPDLDIVEDVIPLANVAVAARLTRRPARVYLAPRKQDLRFEYSGGYARVTVPEVKGHQMVVFEG